AARGLHPGAARRDRHRPRRLSPPGSRPDQSVAGQSEPARADRGEGRAGGAPRDPLRRGIRAMDLHLGNFASLGFSLPQLFLRAAGVAVFLLDLVIPRKDWLGLISLAAMVIVVWLSTRLAFADGRTLFHRSVALDGFALYFKVLLGLAGFAAVFMS